MTGSTPRGHPAPILGEIALKVRLDQLFFRRGDRTGDPASSLIHRGPGALWALTRVLEKWIRWLVNRGEGLFEARSAVNWLFILTSQESAVSSIYSQKFMYLLLHDVSGLKPSATKDTPKKARKRVCEVSTEHVFDDAPARTLDVLQLRRGMHVCGRHRLPADMPGGGCGCLRGPLLRFTLRGGDTSSTFCVPGLPYREPNVALSCFARTAAFRSGYRFPHETSSASSCSRILVV